MRGEKNIIRYCFLFFPPSLRSKCLLSFHFCCGQNQESYSMSFLHLSLLRNHQVAWLCSVLGTVALSVLFATQLNLSTSTCCHLSVMNELLNAVLFANNVNFWNYMYMHFFIKSLIILFTLIHFYHICIFCMYLLNVCVLMYFYSMCSGVVTATYLSFISFFFFFAFFLSLRFTDSLIFFLLFFFMRFFFSHSSVDDWSLSDSDPELDEESVSGELLSECRLDFLLFFSAFFSAAES